MNNTKYILPDGTLFKLWDDKTIYKNVLLFCAENHPQIREKTQQEITLKVFHFYFSKL